MNTPYKEERRVFLTLTHYSTEGPTSPWYIENGGNTGIGNMLFQITSAMCFALKYNAKLYVPGLETFFRCENVKKENSIFRHVCSDNIPLYYSLMDTKIVSDSCQKNIWEYEFKNNIHFNEYFENFQNIMHNRDMIQDMFGPTPSDIHYITYKYPMIRNHDICSIHVRLGPDYQEIYAENHARLYELQNNYFRCIDHMISRGIRRFFVFTNDRNYCQTIFDKNPHYNSQGIQFIYSNERDFVDIWMISLIKHNIVSVSTLAWWGSFLNKNPDQYVVCYKGNRNDLHYPGWVVLG